eukprot:6950320-Prymnesium_polylepis.1
MERAVQIVSDEDVLDPTLLCLGATVYENALLAAVVVPWELSQLDALYALVVVRLGRPDDAEQVSHPCVCEWFAVNLSGLRSVVAVVVVYCASVAILVVVVVFAVWLLCWSRLPPSLVWCCGRRVGRFGLFGRLGRVLIVGAEAAFGVVQCQV